MQDIRWLKSNGHVIGAHTASHKAVSLINDPDEALDEIVRSADRLEQKIGVAINAFAFPYGTPELVSKYALNLASKRFKYIFSNVRGSLEDSPSQEFIFRQNITPGDSMWLVKLIIEGRLNWNHKKLRRLSFDLL